MSLKRHQFSTDPVQKSSKLVPFSPRKFAKSLQVIDLEGFFSSKYFLPFFTSFYNRLVINYYGVRNAQTGIIFVRPKTKTMGNKKKTGLINPKREPLTPEKLRELSELNLSDEQAEGTIQSIDQFVRILYTAINRKEQSGKNENEDKAGG
jgi:hypothetical protein